MAAILGALLVVLTILQRRTASVLITGALVATVGWFFARIYLWFFEPIYRGAGILTLFEAEKDPKKRKCAKTEKNKHHGLR